MSRINWTDDKLLSRLIHNKSDSTRWDNIIVLRGRPSEELFAKALELTKSKSSKSRSIGVDILAQLGAPPRPFLKETLQLYFELLMTETHPEVLMSVLYAIGHNNDQLNKEQIEKVCSFTHNQNSCVKEGVVFALLGIDNLKAVESLVTLSADKLSGIRNWATFGIAKQIDRDNEKIRNALWARVSDRHQETKLQALVGLALRKDNRVIEIIKRELYDVEYGSLLFEAILATGDKQFLPLLRQNLQSIKGDTTINPEWKKELKNCICELAKTKGQL